MSTRPRITFDDKGRCNACVWAEAKGLINWSEREAELNRLLDLHRGSGKPFDCIVPVSGGKDGSYVAHRLKADYGMMPLCVTVNPPLPLPIGQRNLQAFAESGFTLLTVNPDPEAMRVLNRKGLEELGSPYFGWLTAIHTGVIRIAAAFGIALLFYGEDGELEYGGSSEMANRFVYGVEYQKRVYLEGGHDRILSSADLDEQQKYFYAFPSSDEVENLQITHWSYFENWDPYRNYLVAKEHCGLTESEGANSGTFTNFAQNDQALFALHCYLMYLKFGFGRATQDASIEVRRGAMDRRQAVNLVQMFDGQFPEEFISQYLEHYRMTLDEFEAVLDHWADRDLFEKVDGRWRPKFQVV
jgi:N-acetyl sugar amidotransferase